MSKLSVAEAVPNCSGPEGATCAERAALYLRQAGAVQVEAVAAGARGWPAMPRPTPRSSLTPPPRRNRRSGRQSRNGP